MSTFTSTLYIAEGGPTVPPPVPDVVPPTEQPPQPELPEGRKPDIDEPPSPIQHQPVREPVRPIPQRAGLH